ncbi:MAG TPA: hypothetical protein VG326_04955 [Tepidisphaeraceae bacterium]|jgi:hypothetical protein|nr:hypothetical protein [Tepidisphaeraceae bacterium]
MPKLFSVVAIAIAMMLGSYAMAKDTDTTAAKPLHGKVTAITKDSSGSKVVSITISSHAKVKGDPAVETVVAITDSTKVTKAGEAAALSDVAVGTGVNVTLGDDKKSATGIEITVHKKKPAAAPAAAAK